METITLKYPEVKNYVSGKFANGDSKTMEVISPLTGKVISTVPLSSAQQFFEFRHGSLSSRAYLFLFPFPA